MQAVVQTFTSQTSITVTHGFGVNAVALDVFVTDGPNSPFYEKILPLSVIAPDTNSITVTFSVARSGLIRLLAK